MKIHYLFLVIFFVFPLALVASVDHKEGAWLGLLHKKSLTADNFLWVEAQLRYDFSTPTMQQTLYRFGGLRKLNENHEVGLLYAFVQTGLRKEHRPTLQHSQKLSFWKDLQLSSRTRLESRFLEKSDEDSWRLRYLIKVQKTLKEKLALVVWEEPFLNLTQDSWTGNRTFERNRFFLGLRQPLLDMNMEWGYLNQYIPRHQSSASEHIFSVFLFY
jgi:hypothetical protein